MSYDYLFKILIVGDSGVGKSSLMVRYCDHTFSDSHISTIGVDFKIKTITIGGKITTLQLWDTAGQERFRTITSSYYRGAHAIIVVYDVTNQQSFENIKTWLEEINTYSTNKTLVVLVGNKCDLEHNVNTELAKQYADSLNMHFLETSAKDSTGINEVFDLIAEKLQTKMLDFEKSQLSESVIFQGEPVDQCFFC